MKVCCQGRFSVFIQFTHGDLRTQITSHFVIYKQPSNTYNSGSQENTVSGSYFLFFSFYSSCIAMTFKNYYVYGFDLIFHLLFFPSYFLQALYTILSVGAVHSSDFSVGLPLKHIFLTFASLLAHVPENTSNMINQLLIFFSCSLY